MSDDDQAGVRRTNLIKALERGFPNLDQADTEKIADALLDGSIAFGDQPAVVGRNFSHDDPILCAFLAPMGDWSKTLLEGLDTQTPHRLRWAPEHQFLFVLAP